MILSEDSDNEVKIWKSDMNLYTAETYQWLTSEKSDSLGPKLGAPAYIYGFIWGDANVNKHGGKRSEVFQRGSNSSK